MKRGTKWLIAGLLIQGFGALIWLATLEDDALFPLAIIVVVVGSAVFLIGLVAVGVRVGSSDVGPAVDASPAMTDDHDQPRLDDHRDRSAERRSEPTADELEEAIQRAQQRGSEPTADELEEAIQRAQQLLEEGPSTLREMRASTDMDDRRLGLAIRALEDRGAVEMGVDHRWRMRRS